MSDFLLELFSEEIPARMQPAAAQQLRERFEALLGEVGLKADSVETYATPRRLALIAKGLPVASEAVSEERRGPRADAPANAVEGFLKSTGLTRDQLEERDTGKGIFLFANLSREGQPTAELLAAKLPALIQAFQWPKSQRWGVASSSTSSPRWVRPLRAIVALLDETVVSFEALGLTSGRETFGHRFMGPKGAVSVTSPATYAAQLRDAFVILCANERRDIIREQANAQAAAAGLRVRPDAGLEAENAGLTEWPVPLLGKFDPEFLKVPPEIIQLTMRTNQKYFAVESADGTLAPGFVCVANLVAPDGGKNIVAGNERVLSARLSDASFFWEGDKAKALAEHGQKLGEILFHEKLGGMNAKVDRVAKLARWIAQNAMPNVDADLVERAARLAKADLPTGTVGEFPELQGVIGGHLAKHQGESEAVSEALRQHYVQSPVGDVAVAVALADRLDTLVSFFGADIRPTGSKDPFALRRAALGILEMLVSGGRRLSLSAALKAAGAEDPSELFGFFADRLKVQQREAGVRHDLIDAILALGGEDDVVRLLARVKALQSLVQTDDGVNLLAGYKRAANILRIEEKKDGVSYASAVAGDKLTDAAEKSLDLALTEAAAKVEAAVQAEDFETAMQALATLRPQVDAFFKDVIVNAEQAEIRSNRLSLLAKLRETAHLVADFSKIEG